MVFVEVLLRSSRSDSDLLVDGQSWSLASPHRYHLMLARGPVNEDGKMRKHEAMVSTEQSLSQIYLYFSPMYCTYYSPLGMDVSLILLNFQRENNSDSFFTFDLFSLQVVSGSPRGLGQPGSVASKSKLLIFLHGAFMIAAWVCSASLGIILARYYSPVITIYSVYHYL